MIHLALWLISFTIVAALAVAIMLTKVFWKVIGVVLGTLALATITIVVVVSLIRSYPNFTRDLFLVIVGLIAGIGVIGDFAPNWTVRMMARMFSLLRR